MTECVVFPYHPERHIEVFSDLTSLQAGRRHLSVPSKTVTKHRKCISRSDGAMVKVWLGLGTTMTWLGLEKDHNCNFGSKILLS